MTVIIIIVVIISGNVNRSNTINGSSVFRNNYSITDGSFLNPILSLLTPYWHSVNNWLRTDVQSSIVAVLTFSMVLTLYWRSVHYWFLTDILAWGNKIHNAKNRLGKVHKTHEWTQQPFVSKLLTFWTWDFFKKTAQSVYGHGCGLDDPRVRIPVRASVFCFQAGSGAHTACWLVCTGLLPHG